MGALCCIEKPQSRCTTWFWQFRCKARVHYRTINLARAPWKKIVDGATRTERAIDNVPNTATSISAEELEAKGARDIKDALREEIDVAVRAAQARVTAAGSETGRAGNEGVNIRGGLEDNQVLMMIDGIRLPNGFSFGSFATGRGDYIDLGGLKAIELVRGPASTLYGSDGLAGAVSFRTLDPADMFKLRSYFNGFARTGYAGIDSSWNGVLGLAGESGQWQGMLVSRYRQGHLAKTTYAIKDVHAFDMAIEARRRGQGTEVYSARAVAPLPAPQNATPSYAVLDLGSYWQANEHFKIQLNLDNVFDARYWRWSNVLGLAKTSPIKDAYTAPGRQIRVSARYDF